MKIIKTAGYKKLADGLFPDHLGLGENPYPSEEFSTDPLYIEMNKLLNKFNQLGKGKYIVKPTEDEFYSLIYFPDSNGKNGKEVAESNAKIIIERIQEEIEQIESESIVNPEDMDNNISYFKGNMIRYTGKTENFAGGLFYEFEYLEGHKKGQTGLTQNPPK